jgi:hypothetical protein
VMLLCDQLSELAYKRRAIAVAGIIRTSHVFGHPIRVLVYFWRMASMAAVGSCQTGECRQQ